MLTLDTDNYFNDKRLGKRAAILLAIIVNISRVVLQKVDSWKLQVSFYRFFSNPKVTEEALTTSIVGHCIEQSTDADEILIISDTTELNLTKHIHRITNQTGLGTMNNHLLGLGFFAHITIAVNALDKSLIGVADIELFERNETEEEKGMSTAEKRKRRRNKDFEEKESYRWPERAIEAKNRFGAGQKVIAVQDREGDIYESLCLLTQNGVGIVIRCRHDRQIKSGTNGGIEKIKQHFDAKLPQYEFEMEVKGGNSGREARTAKLSLQFETVELLKPENIAGKTKKELPASITVSIVRVKEKPETVPAGEKPIEWLLYSSKLVQDANEALKIIEYYRARWTIEDLFRTLKSDGLNYEDSELETGPALRKLFILALHAAVIMLQMRQARDGNTMQKPALVVSQDQIECLQDILPGLEGKTEKLKNPFPKDNLAWVTWIIARLGGWKGYKSQRPPGVITLRDGWVRFHHIYEGWTIAKDVYKH